MITFTIASFITILFTLFLVGAVLGVWTVLSMK